jgi:hypothetical protein
LGDSKNKVFDGLLCGEGKAVALAMAMAALVALAVAAFVAMAMAMATAAFIVCFQPFGDRTQIFMIEEKLINEPSTLFM